MTKTKLLPWQWTLICSSSTLILTLTAFGIWNVGASEFSNNSFRKQNSKQSAFKKVNKGVREDTIKRLIGRWQLRGEISMIFTPEGKAFMFASNQAEEYRYQVSNQTQPKQLLLSDSTGFLHTQTINFELTPDGQLQLYFGTNGLLLQKVSNSVSLPSVVTIIEKQPLARSINGLIRAKQSEGKVNIGVMNRSQQAFFLENNQFTLNLSKLELGIKSSTQNYAYSIVSINNKRVVQNVSVAKIEGLKSYTGIVFFKKNASTGEVVTFEKRCESILPTRKMPPQPQVSGGEIQCPAGYVNFSRYK